jgi:hypothetical protein
MLHHLIVQESRSESGTNTPELLHCIYISYCPLHKHNILKSTLVLDELNNRFHALNALSMEERHNNTHWLKSQPGIGSPGWGLIWFSTFYQMNEMIIP